MQERRKRTRKGTSPTSYLGTSIVGHPPLAQRREQMATASHRERLARANANRQSALRCLLHDHDL